MPSFFTLRSHRKLRRDWESLGVGDLLGQMRFWEGAGQMAGLDSGPERGDEGHGRVVAVVVGRGVINSWALLFAKLI